MFDWAGVQLTDYPGGVVIVRPKPTPAVAAVVVGRVVVVDVVAVVRYLAIGT